jgi:uncharacterized SAM-binding protein YcdF (DUF218 family)
MFILKQFLKELILPPAVWMILLALVLIFWKKRWARKALLGTLVLIFLLHSGRVQQYVRYGLESRYVPLIDPHPAEPYDAIVVLTGGLVSAGGLIPFPTISETMFRRLDEAWRLYRIAPKPIIVSGGHVDPFTPPRDENKIACDYLVLWGVPARHVIPEPIAAPGDFTVGNNPFSPLHLFPSEETAGRMSAALHEYLGLINYRWRALSYTP